MSSLTRCVIADVLCELFVRFLRGLLGRAASVASSAPGKLKSDDVVYLVREDSRKVGRVKRLLQLEEVVKAARDVDESAPLL